METTPNNGSQTTGGGQPGYQAQGAEVQGDGGAQQQNQRGRAAQRTQGRQSGQVVERGRSREPGLMRWPTAQSPFGMMLQFSREMDRLMDSFFNRNFLSPFGSMFESALPSFGAGIPELWTPRIDVRQKGDNLVICADLPGVRKEDINIECDADSIAISGERREEREEGGEQQGYRMTERSYGSFYRRIPLPDGVNPDEIKASMRDGVLEITVPLPKGQRRRIEIQQ
ncbi:MAG: Hsp20/alpha crystallin family protein [Pseudomonadota bacterium]